MKTAAGTDIKKTGGFEMSSEKENNSENNTENETKNKTEKEEMNPVGGLSRECRKDE